MAKALALGLPHRTLVDGPQVGTEICPDPPIISTVPFTLGTGVTHTDPGIAITADASVDCLSINDDIGLVEGRDYQVTIIIDSVTTAGDGIVANIGGTTGPAVNTVDTHVQTITAGATTDAQLERTGANDFDGSVSAFHIKPILWG